MLILYVTKFIKIEKIKKRSWKPALLYSAIMIVIFSSTIPSYVSEAKESRYNKKRQLEMGTLYTFHYLDIKSNINLKKTAKYNNKNESSYEYVYVTDYGVRYHQNENCSEINRTIIEISRNKVTGMRACRLCAAGDN